MPSLADLLSLAGGGQSLSGPEQSPLQGLLGARPIDPLSLTGAMRPADRAPGGAPPGSYPGNVRGWLNEAIDITGVPQRWLGPLTDLVGRESSGDPRAYNETPVASGQHAQGLLQTIPSTFEAHNLPRLGGIYDPVANAVAAIRYILSRYGSVKNLPASGGY
jgi:hypothetical protein